MNRLRLFLSLVLLSGFVALPALAAEDEAQQAAMTFFEKEVRPILVERCFEWHSNTKPNGGLRMDHIG